MHIKKTIKKTPKNILQKLNQGRAAQKTSTYYLIESTILK